MPLSRLSLERNVISIASGLDPMLRYFANRVLQGSRGRYNELEGCYPLARSTMKRRKELRETTSEATVELLVARLCCTLSRILSRCSNLSIAFVIVDCVKIDHQIADLTERSLNSFESTMKRK